MVNLAEKMSSALDTRAATAGGWLARYRGDGAFVLLTPGQQEALRHRLKSLNLNLGSLAVDLLVERLRVTGFAVNGTPDDALWELWADAGMLDGAAQVQRDSLATGQGFVSIWVDDQGNPLPVPESPLQCITQVDPATRRAIAGFKRWEADGVGHGVLYLADEIVILRNRANVPSGGGFPSTGWEQVKTIPNPTGMVLLQSLTNLGAVDQPFGFSELEALIDVQDALRKVTLDSLVASHENGVGRKWATGLGALQGSNPGEEEEEDFPDPWSGGNDTAMAESPDVRFGQFPEASLSGFQTLIGTLSRQFSALSGVPPHLLGLDSGAAMSADALRAAESTLISKAEARQRTFGRAWAQVAALMLSLRDGTDPRSLKVRTLWSDPATRSEAQAADASVKLHQAGLLSVQGVLERLGYSPREIATEMQRLAAEQATKIALGQ